MFSHRLPDNLEPNEFSKLLARKRAEGARLLDLTESNPTKAGIPYPKDEILEALTDGRSLVYEPSPVGIREAREAVSVYYAEQHAIVHPDQVVITASTSEAYAYIFKLLSDPGDRFLVPSPSYPLFDLLAAMERVTLSPYRLEYDESSKRWRALWDTLEFRGLRARGIIVVNPNNPTGSCLDEAERDELRGISTSHRLPVICDEVFSDYAGREVRGWTESLQPGTGPLSFSMSGLSKVCGLPQLKLGWIVVHGVPREVVTTVQRLAFIADTYLSVGTPIQLAARRLLKLRHSVQFAIRDRLHVHRLSLAAGCHRTGGACRLLASDGGWYAVVEVPASLTDEEWALALLEKDNVVVHPGYFFGFGREAFLVISLLPATDVFEEGVARLIARTCPA